ncbi:MAG: hypothetical protein PHO75_00230 [Candidatus Shapirobacteria bacterium]|nr:hypothetical protein [Candidatus Shapirobacteria bacterium]
MINELNKKIKNLDTWDMACTKLAVMFFVMFLFSVLPAFRDFIQSTNYWIFFLGWVIFAIRPLKRFFYKKV